MIRKLAFINGVRRHRRNPIGFFDALHGQHGQTFRVTLPAEMNGRKTGAGIDVAPIGEEVVA